VLATSYLLGVLDGAVGQFRSRPLDAMLKPRLVIHSVYNGYCFWGRPSVHDLWRDLGAAMSEIRPDWDLSTPGPRQAWDAGDYSPSVDGTRAQQRLARS